MNEESVPSGHHDHHPTCPMTNSPATPFNASAYANDNKHHILLAASGSVATIKIPNILRALSTHPRLSIRLILTPSAASFLQGQAAEQPSVASLSKIPNVDGIYTDESEWTPPWTRGAPILHIELRRWADILVIAPLSANMMGKITNGLSDGLLASVVRAWDTTGLVDGTKKRILVAPAMNTAMWRQPVTGRQVRILEEEWGVREGLPGEEEGWVEVLRPQERELACGDVGDGAMKEWPEVVKIIEERLGLVRNES